MASDSVSTSLTEAGSHPRFVRPGARTTPAEVRRADVLIVGAGIAGLSVALSLPEGLAVEVALKGKSSRPAPSGGRAVDADGSSGHAQGGIAAVFGADDSPSLHLADTLAAGAGLCDEEAVHDLVEEAPAAVRFLEAQGVHLDGTGSILDLTREGGHSRRRVVHAGGDATGREVMRGLVAAAHRRELRLVEESFLVDLLTATDGSVCGALLLEQGRIAEVRASAVVLATGGFGRLFAETTSPPVCTGDGLAAAIRAGAEVADLEFVQFHPTAIQLASDPRPLASEALRGEGAVIRDDAGNLVLRDLPRADLSPRDVVSRAMAIAMRTRGTDHLFLDATAIGPDIAARFPSFVGASRRVGLDPQSGWVPVAPAVHYVMGGVRTDTFGRTSIPGLYAVGEAAESGVHGANRLASNSLVEGVVFGRRAAIALGDERRAPARLSAVEEATTPSLAVPRSLLRRRMTAEAGVLRNGAGLLALAEELAASARPLPEGAGPGEIEEANLTTIARLLVATARRRAESRGAHYRIDLPETDAGWRRHQVLHRNDDGTIAVRDLPVATSTQTEAIAASSR